MLLLPPPPRHTFKVSSMDRNFLWSPISMALLMIGSSVFTASSMGTGGTFSPPAVMINSEEARQGQAPSIGFSPGAQDKYTQTPPGELTLYGQKDPGSITHLPA